MKKLSLEEKINIYFSRYKTNGFFTVKQYLKIRQEERIYGLIHNKNKNKKDIKCK